MRALSQMRHAFLFASFLLLAATNIPAQNHKATSGFSDVKVGAFEADAWNGIVLTGKAAGQQVSFALRIGSKSLGNPAFLDGERIYDVVNAVGPHAPDGSYAKVGWVHAPRLRPVTLEWSRIDAVTVVARLTAPRDMHLVIEAYTPFGRYPTASYGTGADGRELTGEQRLEGVYGRAARLLVVADREVAGSAVFRALDGLRATMDAGDLPRPVKAQELEEGREPAVAGVEFGVITNGATQDELGTAHFVATIGWDAAGMSSHARDLLKAGEIDRILDATAAAYAHSQPQMEGPFAEAPQAIASTMYWNTLYVPALGLEFPSISRRWARNFNGWAIGEWDAFFGSLLTAVESPAQTAATIRAVLGAQTATGLVPNVISGAGNTPDRSQPPVGAYAVWKDYERSPDKDLLEWAYPRLKKWHEWWLGNRGDGQSWRDGNGDGLLEWGSDKGAEISHGGRGSRLTAKLESGMDDSPMYDGATYDPDKFTLDLDDVGLNSLYALDAECLGKIALLLGKTADATQFAAEYARMGERIRTRLWNEQDGIFENRYWDGGFSKSLSPTNFYPMIAGIATEAQAQRMVKEHLLNPKEFWGEYVIPTISRGDPAFAGQYYWRGDIWGPTNYLVYEGLDRYRQDQVALDFARKGYALFQQEWKAGRSDEAYLAWGGSAGADTHYTWGTLLCLIGMEQMINENPWDGLRFGQLSPAEPGSLKGVLWGGHRYDVETGPAHTAVSRDGATIIEANAAIVVRHYEAAAQLTSFEVTAKNEFMVKLQGIAVQVDGTPAALTGGAVKIAAGTHRITLQEGPR